jgi:hypothetical protein
MLTYADVYYIHRSYMRDYYVNDSVGINKDVNACLLDAWDQDVDRIDEVDETLGLEDDIQLMLNVNEENKNTQLTLDVDDILDVKFTSRDANHPLVLAHPGYISVGGGVSRSGGGGMVESKADGLEEDAVGVAAGEVRARAGVRHSALRNSEIRLVVLKYYKSQISGTKGLQPLR